MNNGEYLDGAPVIVNPLVPFTKEPTLVTPAGAPKTTLYEVGLAPVNLSES